MGKFIDMTGWIMSEHGVPDSRITVINRAENQGKHTAWNCVCECGNKIVIRGDQLRSGIAKSCGCLFKEMAAKRCEIVGKNNLGKPAAHRSNLEGQIFNKLKVVNYFGTIDGRAMWMCECECGNTTVVSTTDLKSGHTKSCGCLTSAGELKIRALLEENNINYSQQYSFEDLRDKGLLKFDFAIFKNNKLFCLIEYQGSQHFQNLEGKLWNCPKKHDEMKRQYCKRNQIPLIEISYKDFDKIDFSFLQEKCNL